jgi:hypothetical protein
VKWRNVINRRQLAKYRRSQKLWRRLAKAAMA